MKLTLLPANSVQLFPLFILPSNGPGAVKSTRIWTQVQRWRKSSLLFRQKQGWDSGSQGTVSIDSLERKPDSSNMRKPIDVTVGKDGEFSLCWISGHYCDEFAESHTKELVVREAVGAAIPLAGVGCAIARQSLCQLAGLHAGRPFAGDQHDRGL